MSVRAGIKAAGEDVSQDIADDEDKTYSIRHLILDYCEYTSGHGPPRIIASKQTIRKIFWTLLFLAALAMSSWQINTLFNTYKARPLSTHVSIKHETVCISLAYPGSKFLIPRKTQAVTLWSLRASPTSCTYHIIELYSWGKTLTHSKSGVKMETITVMKNSQNI